MKLRGSNWGSHFLTSTAAILAGGFLAGCASKLTVVSEPTGTMVTVKEPGNSKVKPFPAPYTASVTFKAGQKDYSVAVDPIGSLADRYNATSIKLNSEVYETLPMVGNSPKHRRLSVRLDEKLYVILPSVEVVLDSRRNWKGIVTRTRAYKDVSEQGGAVPTRLPAEFDDTTTVQSLALSPDGDRIVYPVVTFDVALPELKRLLTASEHRIVNVAGANLNAIRVSAGGVEHISSENFRDFFPTFTPNGENLLFASNRRRSGSEDILLRSAGTRQAISDIYVHRDARLMRPTQAENGTIAYSVDDSNPIDPKQRFTVWTLGGPNQFPTQIQVGTQPAISPDGRRIAYIGADGNLWVVNTDGAQATQLTSGADKIHEEYRKSLGNDELMRYEAFLRDVGAPEKMPYSYPSWNKDGTKIVFTGMEGTDPNGRPNEDIWMMNYDGSEKRQLTTNGSVDRYPLLSPDEKYVYFLSNRGGRWAVWRITGPDVKGDRK